MYGAVNNPIVFPAYDDEGTPTATFPCYPIPIPERFLMKRIPMLRSLFLLLALVPGLCLGCDSTDPDADILPDTTHEALLVRIFSASSWAGSIRSIALSNRARAWGILTFILNGRCSLLLPDAVLLRLGEGRHSAHKALRFE